MKFILFPLFTLRVLKLLFSVQNLYKLSKLETSKEVMLFPLHINHSSNKLLEKSPENPTLLAYKGAYIGFTIGISNLKAIYLGRRSLRYIDKSLELDPENIQGNIEKGNSLYYCPSAFGGDKAEAIKYFVKAVKSFEKKGLVVNNWMYINTMTALGQAYEATNQIQLAKLCYEKIIRIFPNFMWVEDELYPDMLKRYNL